MKISNCFVSVVAPLYNDADIVTSFVVDVVTTLSRSYANYEVILVDDGSTDNTVALVTSLLTDVKGIRLLQLSRSFGQEIAIAAGLDSVIGDYTVVILPESDPPALIPQLVEQSRQGPGIIFGVAEQRPQEPLLRRLAVKLFYWYANHIVALNLQPNTTHFRVLSRPAVNAVTQIKDHMRYLHTLSAYVGYTNQSFRYTPTYRRMQPRSKSLGESINLAINIVVANSTQPLRMVSWLGVMASGLDLLYMGYIVAIYLFKQEVAAGWVTQSMQNASMFFFLFLILAVLCEYVGRLLRESRDRPLYYVQGEQNSSVVLTDKKNVVMESVGE